MIVHGAGGAATRSNVLSLVGVLDAGFHRAGSPECIAAVVEDPRRHLEAAVDFAGNNFEMSFVVGPGGWKALSIRVLFAVGVPVLGGSFMCKLIFAAMARCQNVAATRRGRREMMISPFNR